MIVAGFGFRHGASLASLESALERATGGMIAVDALATLDGKTQQLAPLARKLALPLIAVGVERLADQPVATRSPASMAAYGAGSVAEATALAALTQKGRLLAPRAFSSDRFASCALAESSAP
ncbi:cobalamin biosynthesis protein [Sphingobium indicum]|uniref:Precorrin methylase n=2 Tax=Sphingobium indicum TaxID=332055 RepID=A0A1L5BQI8_SPHIB|nr:cobalamin biosynthesis protein [Sphingobium indicum]APL95136.1 precorrin methylase [Sphingobium indicum B90A]KEY99090.1 precorrin methylase [Sphingomonas sp. BHC-A]NYI23489.1 cobalt-precorrin 5A hydrolase [Sphingobium indicum]RYM01645.1 cobalamin biosynthesis protein [Sphingobium indicum]